MEVGEDFRRESESRINPAKGDFIMAALLPLLCSPAWHRHTLNVEFQLRQTCSSQETPMLRKAISREKPHDSKEHEPVILR